MRGVRRLAVLTLASAVATAAALAWTISPAWAHICPIAAEIPIAQPSTIDVGVTVEGATVPDVEIDLPAGLALDRIDAKAGWTVTRSGSTVRYHGGPIEAFTCEYFSLVVTAPGQGAFGVTVIQRTAGGHGRRPLDPRPEQRGESRAGPVRVRGRQAAGAPEQFQPTCRRRSIAGIALIVLGVAIVLDAAGPEPAAIGTSTTMTMPSDETTATRKSCARAWNGSGRGRRIVQLRADRRDLGQLWRQRRRGTRASPVVVIERSRDRVVERKRAGEELQHHRERRVDLGRGRARPARAATAPSS